MAEKNPLVDLSELEGEELDEATQEVLREVWRAEAAGMIAEAAKAEAEAERAKAEAEKARQEADLAKIDVKKARLSLKREEKKQKEEDATDIENKTYTFIQGVSEASVKTCMQKLSQWSRLYPECKMTIVLNTPGGDVIDGMALFDHIISLREKGHQIDIVVRGMAASMGGILLQAASKRILGKEAWVLIHRAAFLAMGKTFQVEDEVKWVKRIEDRICDIFVSRSQEAFENGTSEKALTKQMITRNWDRKDWWLTSEECIKLGIADEVA